MNKVCIIGYLPPPVHGVSLVTAGIKKRLEEVGCTPYILDLSTKGLGRSIFFRLSKLGILLREVPMLVRWLMSSHEHTVYIAISGGKGQLIDMFLLLLARIFAAKVYIHHHSFQYINRYCLLTKFLLFIAGRKAKHIMLCENMAEKLKARYQLPDLNTWVLSNAAFIDLQQEQSPAQNTGLLHIGFMSNLAREKGIDCFIDLLEAAQQQGFCLRASIAGPFQDEETRKRIMQRINHLGEMVSYIGPQYGQDKDVFLGSLDVLLFPTQYNNEAAPLVIYEALSHGVPVIAKVRGCLEEMVREGAGLVLADRQFKQGALSQLIRWDKHREDLCYAKETAFSSFLCMQKDERTSLNDICLKISLGCDI